MQAVIDQPFTFSVLFVNVLNQPIEVDDPTITIFRFSDAGMKQTLVDEAAMAEAVPAEVGRYTYTYTIPSTLTDGDAIYAEMAGSDPETGVIVRTEQPVTAISPTRATGGSGSSSGLVAQFVKGG